MVILIIVILAGVILFCIAAKQEELQPIKIEEDRIQEAQKEMEISADFLNNNMNQILWIRGIFFTIWMGFIGIILKEYYLSNSIRKRIEINKHKCLIRILLLSAIILALGLELPIQVEQVAHTNRIWQLDNAVNTILLDPPQEASSLNHPQIKDFQNVFAPKNFIDLHPKNRSFCNYFCNYVILIWNAIRAPTFFIFYGIIFVFWLIFPCFLRESDCSEETTWSRYCE